MTQLIPYKVVCRAVLTGKATKSANPNVGKTYTFSKYYFSGKLNSGPIYNSLQNINLRLFWQTMQIGCNAKSQIYVLAIQPTVHNGGVGRGRVCHQQGYPVLFPKELPKKYKLQHLTNICFFGFTSFHA